MYKRKPKWYTTVSVVSVFLFCLLLIVIRWMNVFNPDIVVINEEINSHISNFALSILLNVYICFMFLLAGNKFQSNLIVGTCLIIANFIYELFLSILNTVNIVDAIYGTIGIIISLIYLYLINKYGFKESI